jgi:hypothetical protein
MWESRGRGSHYNDYNAVWRAEVPAFGSRQGQKFPVQMKSSRPPLGPSYPPIQWVPQARIPRDKEAEGMKLNTHLHIVARLRRSGVTTPHPRTLLWCVQERPLHLFSHGSRALMGHGLMREVPQSHSDTPHLVRLFRTSDQPVAETSTWQHTTLTKDRHPCPRRNSNPQSQ